MGIEAWYWFPKGRQEQTCHGELLLLWAFLMQRLLFCFNAYSSKHRRQRCQEGTTVDPAANGKNTHTHTGSIMSRMESICEAQLGRVTFSVLQLESRTHMGGCKASAIVSSSWLLAEATQVYRGVKVINTSSGGLRFVLVVWKRKTN